MSANRVKSRRLQPPAKDGCPMTLQADAIWQPTSRSDGPRVTDRILLDAAPSSRRFLHMIGLAELNHHEMAVRNLLPVAFGRLESDRTNRAFQFVDLSAATHPATGGVGNRHRRDQFTGIGVLRV